MEDKLIAPNGYFVNLKAGLDIQQILKSRAQLLTRLQLIERQAAAPSTQPGKQRA